MSRLMFRLYFSRLKYFIRIESIIYEFDWLLILKMSVVAKLLSPVKRSPYDNGGVRCGLQPPLGVPVQMGI